MDPGVQIRFSPQRAERRQGKGEADPSARGRPRTGAPAREPVRFVRAPSLPPPPDGFAVAVLQSPHRRPPPPPPPPRPAATSPTSRRLPAPPPDMPLRSSPIDPAAPIASRGREHFVALPSRVQRRRRHPEFTAGVSLRSSPPASPSFFNLCERAALSPAGAVAVTSAAEAPLPPSDLLSELSFTAEKARYPELTFTGGYPRRRKGPSPTGFLLAWESRPAVT